MTQPLAPQTTRTDVRTPPRLARGHTLGEELLAMLTHVVAVLAALLVATAPLVALATVGAAALMGYAAREFGKAYRQRAGSAREA